MKTFLPSTHTVLPSTVKPFGIFIVRDAFVHRVLSSALLVFLQLGMCWGDEEVWSYGHGEEAFSVSLNAPDGTADAGVGSVRAVEVRVQRITWEVWVSDMGHTDTREYSSDPVSGASLAFTIEDAAPGTLSASSGATDSSGVSTFSLTMGQGAAVVKVVAVSPSGTTTSSATLVFTPPESGTDPDPGSDPDPEPENWSYSRTESLLSATVTSSNGSTGDLTPATTREVHLHARYDSWEIWESDHGNVETRNATSIPAAYAEYSWSIQSGDGSIPAGAAGQTDANGDTDITFTMGSASSELRADVSYGGSGDGVTNATLAFSPPADTTGGMGTEDPWHYDHTEGYISASIWSDGSTTDVSEMSLSLITANVQYTSWEIWVDGQGGTDIRNNSTGPAIGAPVSFCGGCFNAASSITDSSGNATANFSMGNQNTHVVLSASYSLGTTTASLDFTAPNFQPPPIEPPPGEPPPVKAPPEVTWAWHHNEGSVSVSASGSGASVSYSTKEVWLSSLGLYEDRNPASGTAINAPISFAVTNGDAVITSSDASTNGSGFASCSVLGGSQTSTVTVSASFGGSSGSASFTVGAADSDSDGYSDAAEHAAGTNPNDPNSHIDHMPTSRFEQWESITMTSSGTYEEEFDFLSFSWISSRYISGAFPPPPDSNLPPPPGLQWDGDWIWVSNSMTSYYVEPYTYVPPRRWVHVWLQQQWTRKCKLAAYAAN